MSVQDGQNAAVTVVSSHRHPRRRRTTSVVHDGVDQVPGAVETGPHLWGMLSFEQHAALQCAVGGLPTRRNVPLPDVWGATALEVRFVRRRVPIP